MNKIKTKEEGSNLATYATYEECVGKLKKLVFLIVRGRKLQKNGKEMTNWVTLGTGFLASPGRLVTAAHVINDHKDGDLYMLLWHADDDKAFMHAKPCQLDKELFLYPEIDVAVMYIDDDFYEKTNMGIDRDNDFLHMSKDVVSLGREVGILGYPLSKIEFHNEDLQKPKIGNIIMRTDQGVVNCRYRLPNNIDCYEFTMAFNKGNSGGPIFDASSGKVISIVKGFKTIPMGINETSLTDEQKTNFKAYKQDSYLDTISATYSVGIASKSMQELLTQHNINFY